MTVQPGDAETELAPTTLGEPGARAYTIDDVGEPVPYRQENPLLRWGMPVGALLLGVSALVGAVMFGLTQVRGGQVAPTPATAPMPEAQEFRSPALLKPDQDTAFLMELDKGSVLYDSAGAAVHNAKLMCSFVNEGRDRQQLAVDFARFEESEITADEALVFINLAVKHYCPTD